MIERRDKLAKGKKEKFLKDLDSFFKSLNEGIFNESVNNIIYSAQNQLNSVLYLKNLDEVSQLLKALVSQKVPGLTLILIFQNSEY